jgi:large subunit ribosomal protein L10
MPRAEKEAAVADLRKRIETSQGIFVTEYRGLKVRELADLRRSLRERSAQYKVVRNTLTKLALSGTPFEDLSELFVGPVALAFYTGDPVEVAKALVDFSKEHPALVIKGGTLDGRRLGAEDVERLARLEPREVLLAKAAGALKAPLYRAIQGPSGLLSKAAWVFKARLDAMGAESAA